MRTTLVLLILAAATPALADHPPHLDAGALPAQCRWAGNAQAGGQPVPQQLAGITSAALGKSDALAVEGRRAAAVVLGLTTTFLAAGTIEGFLTGSGLPAWLRVGVGAGAWVAFVGYLWARGRDAAARGLTGALGEDPVPAPSAGPLAGTAG